VFINGIAVAVAAIAAVRIFWGKDTVPRQAHPHEAPFSMLFPPLALVAVGLLFGVAPTLVDPVLGAAARAIAPGFAGAAVETAYDLLPVLEAMLGTILAGVLAYWQWDRLHRLVNRIRHLEHYGPESWYRNIIGFLPQVVSRQTRLLQHGLLPGYLLTLIGGAVLLMLGFLFAARPAGVWPDISTLSAPVLGASLLIAAGAVAALCVRDHLVLLLVAGLVGYGSAILFLFTGAPDLAFTQFAVETIFVVVVASVLLRLRRHPAAVKAPAEKRLRPLALCVSVAFGALLTGLVLLVSGRPFDARLSDFFAAQSLPAAHGRNVVNVIIVDFRALDTLGEIAALAFALLAALPLLKIAGRRRP
jgi:multicomponent Na+:H+ antiporter subunit A